MKISIPISPSDGNKYLINFSTFEEDIIPDSVINFLQGVEIIEIVLERVEGDNMSNAYSLSQISSVIWNFMQENEASILYFYCDDMHDLPRRRKSLSPQEYRSLLFSKMFDKAVASSSESYINMPIILKAEDRDIFIHLISRYCYIKQLECLKNSIFCMGKD